MLNKLEAGPFYPQLGGENRKQDAGSSREDAQPSTPCSPGLTSSQGSARSFVDNCDMPVAMRSADPILFNHYRNPTKIIKLSLSTKILKFCRVDDRAEVPGKNRPGLLESLSEEKRNLTTLGAEDHKTHDIDKTQKECRFVWTLK